MDAAVCAKMERFRLHWQTLADARGGLPTRHDFDPTAVPDLLPNLMLVEANAVGDEPELCRRVLLAGTRIAAAIGSELAGCDLDALPHEDGAHALAAAVDMCLAQRLPIPGEFTVAAAPAGWTARRDCRIAGFRFLAVPFSATHADPTVAIVLVVFVAADGGEVRAEWLDASATA